MLTNAWYCFPLFYMIFSKCFAATSSQPPRTYTNPNAVSESYAYLGTKPGNIQGRVVNENGVITSRFLGIPYAQPPVGNLRFQAPFPYSGWMPGSVWKAVDYAPLCPQYSLDPESGIFEGKIKETEVSEDCLYLNIYIPRNISSTVHVNTLSLPVMVFIHGGGFRDEPATMHSGWYLASKGEVIVATIQYRRGVLGFMSLSEQEITGNFGLLDQTLAIQWIWDNIREFGGDPETITIVGESDGGVSVGYHVISPKSRGIFTRAISQSGTILSPHSIHREPTKAGLSLVKAVECDSPMQESVLQCLRNVPIGSLLKESDKIAQKYGNWAPVIDGHFIQDEPIRLLEKGHMNPVEYIIGVSQDEGYYLAQKLPYDLEKGISMSDLEDAIYSHLKLYYKDNLQEVFTAVKLEYAFCSQSEIQRAQTLVDFLTEMEFMAPAERTARLFTKDDYRKMYFYEFAQKPSFTNNERPSYVTASHDDDLNFLFGQLEFMLLNSTQQERNLGRQMMRSWTNFAKTGNPNPVDDGIPWKPYTSVNSYFLEFNIHMNQSSLKSNIRPRRIAFWNDYMPHLENGRNCHTQLDFCRVPVLAAHSKTVKMSTIVYVLSVVCVVLCILVIILSLKLFVPKDSWSQCRRTRKYKGNEPENKKLHPLPYCDENSILGI